MASEKAAFQAYTEGVSNSERLQENQRRAVVIASMLVKNRGFVGNQMEEERAQLVEQEILGVFNANYKSVQEMKNIADRKVSGSSERQIKMAGDNLQVLGDAGVVALNYLFRDYTPKKNPKRLPLDGMAPDSIERLFDGALKGIGEIIVARNILCSGGDKNVLLRLIRPIKGITKEGFSDLLRISSGKYTNILKGMISRIGIGDEDKKAVGDIESSGGVEGKLGDIEEILKRHLDGKESISTAIQNPNQMLKILNLEALPDDLKAKLERGISLSQAEIDALPPDLKREVVKNKNELAEIIQSYRAKNLAFEEYFSRKRQVEGEIDDKTPIDIKELFFHLDHIERGGFKSDDLTRNAHHLERLYGVIMGHYTNVGETEIRDGHKVVVKRLTNNNNDDELPKLKRELGNRLYLHDSNLMMSRCNTIEDYVRALMTLYEGDTGESACKMLVKTILERPADKRGVGYEEIPTDMAWDLRQLANHGIFGFVNEIVAADWFIASVKGNKPLLEKVISRVRAVDKRGELDKLIERYNGRNGKTWTKQDVLNELNKGQNIDNEFLRFALLEALRPKEEIKADRGMRLNEAVYQNFWLMEKNGTSQYEIIKEYMLQKMQKYRYGDGYAGGKWEGSDEEARRRVEKAFTLALKATVAFADNRCDIKYSGNEYSPLLNFWYSRISDNRTIIVDGDEEADGVVKSKFVGAVDNIKFMWALAPFWLEWAKKDSVGMHSPYDPLLTSELDFDKISRGSDMLYAFTQIISSQSLPLHELFTSMKSLDPKQMRDPTYINGVQAKIIKMVEKGFKPARVYFTTYNQKDWYGGWESTDKKKQEKSSSILIQRAKEYWMHNGITVMRDGTATYEDFVMFINNLKWNGFMSHIKRDFWGREVIDPVTGNKVVEAGGSFLPTPIIDEWLNLTRAEAKIRSRDDALAKLAEKRRKFGLSSK